MRVRYVKKHDSCDNTGFTIGNIYEVIKVDDVGDFKLYDDNGDSGWLYKTEVELIEETDQHYNNTNGSLYKFAQDHELNAWEFDIIKRITRCRKKGQFKEDLEKTKRVIDLYLKEFEA
jgi:hypothetical protein